MSTQHPSDLPPLPEPAHRGPGGTGDYFNSFTADQMQAYARATLAQAQPSLTDDLEQALENLVKRCNHDQMLCNDDAVVQAEAALERLYKFRKAAIATQAAQPEPTVKESLTVEQPVQAQGVSTLPERETEAMHDAVMSVLYRRGTTRENTNDLWQAYRSVLLAAAPQAAPQQAEPLSDEQIEQVASWLEEQCTFIPATGPMLASALRYVGAAGIGTKGAK